MGIKVLEINNIELPTYLNIYLLSILDKIKYIYIFMYKIQSYVYR